MLKTKRVTLGEHSYVLRQLPTAVGLTTLTRITKVLGPAFGAAFKTLKSDDELSLKSLGIAGIGELITQLAERISPEELASLTDIFVSHTDWDKGDGSVVPLKSVYALHFGGDYSSLFGLLVEHINFNFASFYKGLGITAPQG